MVINGDSDWLIQFLDPAIIIPDKFMDVQVITVPFYCRNQSTRISFREKNGWQP